MNRILNNGIDISNYTINIIKKHVILCNKANEYAQSIGLNFKLDPFKNIQAIERGSKRFEPACSAARTEHRAPIPFESQMRTAIDAIKKIEDIINNAKFDETTKICKTNLVLLGMMQLGKTVALLWIAMVAPAFYYLLTNKKSFSYINLPSYKNIFNQTKNEFEGMFDFWANVSITYNNENIQINEYYNDLCGIKSESLWEDFLAMRIPTEQMKLKELTFPKMKEYDLMFEFIDEVQIGSDRKSVLGKMEKETPCKILRICNSATPSELMAIQTYAHSVIVSMWVPKGFLGPITYNGHKLPTMEGYVERLPEIHDYMEYLPKMLNKELTLNHKSLLAEEGKIYTKDEIEEENKFINEMAEVYTNQNITNDKFPVFFVRISDENKYAERFCKLIKEKLPEDYEVLPYFGNLPAKIKNRTVKSVLIDDYVSKSKRVMIVNVGRSTAGDSYPSECKYYLDFTSESGNYNDDLQGTYGRSCGNGDKESIVLLNSAYARNLKKFIANGLVKDKIKTLGTPLRENKMPISKQNPKSKSHCIKFTENVLPDKFVKDDIYGKIYKLVYNWINKYKRVDGIFGVENQYFREIFSKPVLRMIEERDKVFLADWGETYDISLENPEGDFVAMGSDPVGRRFIYNIHQFGSKSSTKSRSDLNCHNKDNEYKPSVTMTPAPHVKCLECGSDTRDRVLTARLNLNVAKPLEIDAEYIEKRKRFFNEWYAQPEAGNLIRGLSGKELRHFCCWNHCKLIPLSIYLRYGNNDVERFNKWYPENRPNLLYNPGTAMLKSIFGLTKQG